jgi:hypothetical protein
VGCADRERCDHHRLGAVAAGVRRDELVRHRGVLPHGAGVHLQPRASQAHRERREARRAGCHSARVSGTASEVRSSVRRHVLRVLASVRHELLLAAADEEHRDERRHPHADGGGEEDRGVPCSEGLG